MKLPRALQKFAEIIVEVSDERSKDPWEDNGIWVYLKDGLWVPELETHFVNGRTFAECAKRLPKVEPCPCHKK